MFKTVFVAVEDVPSSADKLYEYLVPDGISSQAVPGAVCTVPFGRGDHRRVGFILKVLESDDVSRSELKHLISVRNGDEAELFFNDLTLSLITYIRDKTFCSWFDASKLVLPSGYTKNSGVVCEKTVKLNDVSAVGGNEKQKKLIELLREKGELSLCRITDEFGMSRASVCTLEKKGIVSYGKIEVYSDPTKAYTEGVKEDKSPIMLSDEQSKAYSEITKLRNSGKTHLLYGVTGSGKTLVYIKLIDDVLADGKSAILLIPEISLTFQIVRRLISRYGDQLAVLHSALTERERYDTSRLIALGKKRVVVGTRSAVFAPVKDLGIIIIDEEQENTYKSEMNPRYSAIDTAAFIALKSNSLLLLASATPSFESFYRAESGRITKSTLTQRFNGQPLPEIIVADMHNEVMAGNRSIYSSVLLREIEKNIKSGEQSILFLNRRGYNSFVSCLSCGEPVKCPYCGIALSYHKNANRLMCHYCSYSTDVPKHCDKCGSELIRYKGAGTQKAEDELLRIFPELRIQRMDADTVTGKTDRDDILNSVKNHECDVLLGTQMITKGLDFSNVTLVGVLMADMSLYSSDFRAYEKTFSLITQVVGRAGRAEKHGRAVVQTFSPTHRVLKYSFNQDYEAFYNNEMALRRSLVYPPYCDLCQAVFVAPTEEQAFSGAEKFIEMVSAEMEGANLPVRIIKPKPTSVPMVDGRYRVRTLIRCKDVFAQREIFRKIYIEFSKDKECKEIQMTLDMNPAVVY